MKFENQKAFEQLISTNGLNLFLGAGFSVLAYDHDGDKLMLGYQLKNFLIEHFELNKYQEYSLPKIANHLKRNRKDDLYFILKNKYNVKGFSEKYNCITNLPVKNIFTTNIDNLCERIYDKAEDVYLSNVDVYGFIDSPGVNLYKLHGSVTYPHDKELYFSSTELTGAFLRDAAFWHTVSLKIAAHPTLFWGTNLEDPNIIDLLNPDNRQNRPSSPRWIQLLPDEKYDLIAEEYSNDGYRIIRATTQELLDFFSNLSPQLKKPTSSPKANYKNLFPKNFIGSISKSNVPSRPISNFYQGDEPVWSDIFSEKLVKISLYNQALDRIQNKADTLLLGPPGSGKTTLLMQLAVSKECKGLKFFFDSIDPKQALFLLRHIESEDNIIIFIDNLGDNIEAYNILKEKRNITFVLADRDLRYESIKHIAKIKKSQIIDVSDLPRSDLQKICDNMSKPLPRYFNERTSLFEVCYSAWTGGNLTERIKSLIKELEDEGDDILEFYTLMTYVRYTGIFASMDMLLCYYTNDSDIDYRKIYGFHGKIYTLIDENSPYKDTYQDYFSLRSRAFCESSLKHIPPKFLAKVLRQFHNNVHRGIIKRYDIFRRKAFDADITTKAFLAIEDGKDFYEGILKIENNPFVRHQYALYLWRKGDVDGAWSEIDTAYTISNGKIYSINNTHAFILFDININKVPDDKGVLISTLQNSFKTLDNCLKQDKRKSYHVITYANHAIQYYEKFHDTTAFKYITLAYNYITTELSKDQYIPREIYRNFISLKKEIEKIKQDSAQSG